MPSATLTSLLGLALLCFLLGVPAPTLGLPSTTPPIEGATSSLPLFPTDTAYDTTADTTYEPPTDEPTPASGPQIYEFHVNNEHPVLFVANDNTCNQTTCVGPAAAGEALQAAHNSAAEQKYVSSDWNLIDHDDKAFVPLTWTTAATCSNQANVENWRCPQPWCSGSNLLYPVYTFNNNETYGLFGYVGVSKATNTVVVAFRGSTTLNNWLEDAQFEQDAWVNPSTYNPSPTIKVHHGFYGGWKQALLCPNGAINPTRVCIGSTIAKAFENCGGECDKLLFTGHSLGGALAGLGAYTVKQNTSMYNAILKASGKTEVQVQWKTFGSPRIGNLAFAQDFPNYVDLGWRMTHTCDPVPHLPLAAMQDTSYHHVYAQEIWQTNTEKGLLGTYSTCPDTVAVPFQPTGENFLKCSNKEILHWVTTLYEPTQLCQNMNLTDHEHYMGYFIKCEDAEESGSGSGSGVDSGFGSGFDIDDYV